MGNKPMLRSYGRLFRNFPVLLFTARVTLKAIGPTTGVSHARKKASRATDRPEVEDDVAAHLNKTGETGHLSDGARRTRKDVALPKTRRKRAKVASDEHDLSGPIPPKTRGLHVEVEDAAIKKAKRGCAAVESPPSWITVSQTTSNEHEVKTSAVVPLRTLRATTKGSTIPARLLAPTSSKHHDLATFLAYASAAKLKTTTTVYRGTLFEYTVASTLRTHGFDLHRTGRSNDLGIDLLGWWDLPSSNVTKRNRDQKGRHNALKVLIQCKATAPKPSTVRELEGAYVGAPAGWRGDGVLAILVASREATKGVREALQRSQWPMALMQITVEGELKQFLWNPVAARMGLEGLNVRLVRQEGDTHDGGRLELVWLGQVLKAEVTSK